MRYFLLSLLPLHFLFAQQNQPLFPVSTDRLNQQPESVFNEVKQKLLSSYYTDTLKENDLYWAAIKGMLEHVSPPDNPGLARFWSAEEYEKIVSELKGEAVSLGIKTQFDPQTSALSVVEIEGNSPAASRLLLYDRILRIDDKPLKGLSTSEVSDLLNGPEGSKVKLTVQRDLEILQVSMTRARFEVKNLSIHRIPSKAIAWIEITKVYQDLAEELSIELEKLKEQGYRKLILDLRHNSGGVLNDGIQVANLFLQPRNIIVRTQSRAHPSQIIAADKEGYLFELIVLIDGQTASAAEIIVAAFQDHKRATILGTKTFGKGVIETTYALSTGDRIKFITSAMYSPLGKSWQSKGLLPDFLIEQNESSYQALQKLSADQRLAKDIYLITALKFLSNN